MYLKNFFWGEAEKMNGRGPCRVRRFCKGVHGEIYNRSISYQNALLSFGTHREKVSVHWKKMGGGGGGGGGGSWNVLG